MYLFQAEYLLWVHSEKSPARTMLFYSTLREESSQNNVILQYTQRRVQPDQCYFTVHSEKSPARPMLFYSTLREESSQTNVILQYKLLASILSAVCSVIQQS